MEQRLYTNPVKARLRNREKLSAAWIQMNSPIACEIMAQQGFDVLCVDMEHSPADVSTLVSLLQAMNGYASVPFVRAPWNDPVIIKKILDVGAMGIHIPYVNTYEEALLAARACKYPPVGIRGTAASPRAVGFGTNRFQYMSRANDQIVVMVAMETPEAVENLDRMLTIDMIDGIFIGPMDLSTSMGHMGDFTHPEVQKMINRIEEKVLKHSDKFLGTVASNMAGSKALYDKGYSYVLFTADHVCMRLQAESMLKEFREYKGE